MGEVLDIRKNPQMFVIGAANAPCFTQGRQVRPTLSNKRRVQYRINNT
jgi:hypothetical protein